MHIRTKRRHGTAGQFMAGVGALILVLVIVFHQHIASILSGAIAFVGAPHQISYDGLPRTVLIQRLKDAEEELSRIRYQSVLYTYEVERNQELSALLNLPETGSYARGTVVVRPPRTHYDTLLVAIPDGVQVVVGDEVLAFGTVVGAVSEVRADTILATLYSSPGATLDVRVGEPSAIVVMRGLGAGAFTFDVPKEINLKSGDTVRAAHTEAVVAIVQSITSEPERTTAVVYAAAPVGVADMHIIEFVRARSFTPQE